MTEVNIGSICLQAKIRTFTYGHVGNPEPCGGRRSLFFASAKKTNEKKADPAGGRAIRLSNVDDFVVRPGVPAGFCRYRLD
ncbi:hypothetical protein ACU4GI_13600 [Cupriavidus basilensis]